MTGADDFVHLRVASSYSMQFGASDPSSLVAAAAQQGMSSLALTDRDGLYGAVRFVKACLRTGVRPVVGVDFATAFSPGHRLARVGRAPSAVKGGSSDDLWRARQVGADKAVGLPRVVVMGRGDPGWARLCRLTSAVHLRGQRGEPVITPELIGQHASGDLLVFLGADSELGQALTVGDQTGAEAELARWAAVVDRSQLVVAVTDQIVAGNGENSRRQAARMLRFADEHGLRAVLTNRVRMVEPAQAMLCDVLDSARRLLPLDRRAIDRSNAEGWLKPADAMAAIAEVIASDAGRGPGGGAQLLASTCQVGDECIIDPAVAMGMGSVHLPELERLGTTAEQASTVLRGRCEAGIGIRYGQPTPQIQQRLDDELAVIRTLGFESYFLTVAEVVDMIRGMGVRCAARGSGAGSMVNYLLGISGADPLAYGLIMERFLSPRRQALPDIDLDVEADRRTEIYTKVLERFGGDRVACVAMIDSYRVRHAVRDVGSALSLAPAEVDAMAKAFPHIRARDARSALHDLPELRAAGLADRRLDVLFDLVEQLDGLPRHVALHPCGVLLSDASLGDRTPIEASFGGFPMSQFDKDDVEDLGLLKLDILGIRMQSSVAHCLSEIERTQGPAEVPDIDALAPFDDPETYDMIAHAQTLGCFQIESPGQRELLGKFGPETFEDLIIDISLFRPGPVKSDMVIPFLNARQGWTTPRYLHPTLEPVLAETRGVVVFHEQVIKIISVVTGCDYARADEARRALGDLEGQREVKEWLVPRARLRGYDPALIERIWKVLASFASFGFCKAHATAFALPTYQSAWLKRHWPAHFLAGVLTHDPGMYPKRLIVEEARRMGIAVRGVDVNRSKQSWQVERCERYDEGPGQVIAAGLPDGSDWAIRVPLSDVKAMEASAVVRIEAGQPYHSLSDFWARAGVDAPVVENLIMVGAFDELYGIDVERGRRRDQVTRRDLLLRVADLKRAARVDARTARRGRGLRAAPVTTAGDADAATLASRQAGGEVVAARTRASFAGVQLALDFEQLEQWDEDELGPAIPGDVQPSGLPEMDSADQLSAELDVLGVDVSAHAIDFYREFLEAMQITWSHDLVNHRNKSEQFVAGVKVATQTPPVRSGRRVLFLTLDDSFGPIDATFFEDAQGPYASTVFSSWLLMVRGELRRTGPHGISLRATGAWDLSALYEQWRALVDDGESAQQAASLIRAELDQPPVDWGPVGVNDAFTATEVDDSSLPAGDRQRPRGAEPDTAHSRAAGGMGRRVLVHPTGFAQSPYADIKTPDTSVPQPPSRKLWHSSPGSSGR